MHHRHLCSLSSPREPEQPLFLQLWLALSQRGGEDQDVQLRDVPAWVLAALQSQAASSLSIEAALHGQEGPASRMRTTLDGCVDAQSVWLLYMDLTAGKVAAVSPAKQVRAAVLQSRGTCNTGIALGCSCGVWASSTISFLQ